jgi:hypothetical protein
LLTLTPVTVKVAPQTPDQERPALNLGMLALILAPPGVALRLSGSLQLRTRQTFRRALRQNPLRQDDRRREKDEGNQSKLEHDKSPAGRHYTTVRPARQAQPSLAGRALSCLAEP